MTKSWKQHYWYGVACMRKRIELIIEMLQPDGKTILEVGCNEGFVSRALEEAGAKEVIAIDSSKAMVEKAKSEFGINAHLGNINSIQYIDRCFDAVVGGEVLEHIENPFAGLQEMFRVAKSQVLVTLPIGRYWLGEPTHQWELAGNVVSHDSSTVYCATKDILLLMWTRRRNGDLKDIPPFNTEELKKEFNIK
jgi:ubiquinone/menaquinone biosynthesis C-methylase UbiE